MPYAPLISPGDRVSLKDFDPGNHDSLEKADGCERLTELAEEIGELQELMYATKKPALLCVFQGLDTAGKDGAINRVLSYLNIQSCRATYFKVPTEEEAAHDFLWRVHSQVPAQGGITLFNRSHYEDVLVVRVHNLVPDSVWKRRYDQINAFERLLASSGTVILKFFLHISKEEQEERLLKREGEPLKAWKLSVQDWKERQLWDQYTEAFDDALTKCSIEEAPWRVVPSDHKWFRDLAVAEAIRNALRPFRKEWEAQLEKMGKTARAELKEYRKES